MSLLILLFLSTCAYSLVSQAKYMTNPERPLVISHRGACGTYPDHSLGAHTTAYFQGVDFTEADLQVTKDNVLVLSHNPTLKEYTNIEQFPQFANRMKNISFVAEYKWMNFTNDWLINDFTIAELKLLRTKSRFPSRNPWLNYYWPIMTFDEEIELLKTLNNDFPSKYCPYKVGIYAEVKTPWLYTLLDVDITALTLQSLVKNNISTVSTASLNLPIILQSFNDSSLKWLHQKTDLPLVQLIHDYHEYSWEEMAGYCHGVGPKKSRPDLEEVVEKAHKYKLLVHPWEMQDDFLVWSDNAIEENLKMKSTGIDGVFTEFPHTTMMAFTMKK